MPDPDLILHAALDRLEQLRDTTPLDTEVFMGAVGAILALERLLAMLEARHECSR